MWLNKTLENHSESLDITIHDVEDGDHNDLYVRLCGCFWDEPGDIANSKAWETGWDIPSLRDGLDHRRRNDINVAPHCRQPCRLGTLRCLYFPFQFSPYHCLRETHIYSRLRPRYHLHPRGQGAPGARINLHQRPPL